MSKLFGVLVVIVGAIVVINALIIPLMKSMEAWMGSMDTTTATIAIDGETNPLAAWRGATSDINATSIETASY